MNRIDQLGNTRLSMNVSMDRQTPKSDFGDKIQAGLNTATGAVASGLGAAGNFVPGASILSAAVSSLNTMGSAAQGATSQYAATGVTSLGGGGTGGLSTTVGTGGTAVGGLGGGTGGVPTVTQYLGNTGSIGTASLGNAGSGMAEQASQMGQMLQVQMAMQRENQIFTTVSNVLKTRHDTVKNTIQNVH